MNVGIIGLGDIARKAYLPVITTRNVNLHLCSRDTRKLDDIGNQYRISNLHKNIDSLIGAGLKAAFVHTATPSHEEIVRQLLQKNIHVYVDKPLTYSYESAASLVQLAKSKGLLLKVGFNRRHAPAYVQLKDLANPNMIVMQKNRNSLPGEARKFIFDDFIHVIDTLLFLMKSPPRKIDVQSRLSSGLLYHLVVTLTGADGMTAIGIMNRDSGTTEERLEVFSSSEKRVVINLSESTIYKNIAATKLLTDDWQTMLRTRGIEDIVDDFLAGVAKGDTTTDEVLLTHEICEKIVTSI
jgi:virulence factor